MIEADLAAKIVKWLNEQHYEVYQEVSGNQGVADIVAVMDRRLWVIETKTSLSLAVMQQAHKWKGYAHWVSVGVPFNSGHGFPEMVCRQFGIGVLRVSMRDRSYSHSDITESVSPILNRKAVTKHIKLCEAQKSYAVAGNNKSLHWSPYKQTCSGIVDYVKDHPGCCLKEVVENVRHHYASRSGAKQCIAYWAQAGKVPGIRCERDGRHLRFYANRT